jgi:hypothetical protein
MMSSYEKKLRQTILRCGLNLLLEKMGTVFLLAGVVFFLAVLTQRLSAVTVLESSFYSLLGVSVFLAVVLLCYWQRPRRIQVAVLLDKRLGLKERFSTILTMQNETDPFAQAAVQEAHERIGRVDVNRHFPVGPTRRWFYTGGVWLIVGLLVLYLPQKDLFGFLKKKKEREDIASQLEINQSQIKESTMGVKLAVKRLGIEDLEADLEELDELGAADKPAEMQRHALRKLGSLQDKLQSLNEGEKLDSVRLMQKMMTQLPGSPQQFSQQLRQALGQGDFKKAADLIKQQQDKIAEGDLSKQQNNDMARQMQELAEQLQKLATQQNELEKELEKRGLDPKLAKMDPQAFREALQKQGLEPQRIEELLQKAAACRMASNRCNNLGNSMAACGASGAMSEDSMSDLASQLDDLAALREQMKLAEAGMKEIEDAMACMGQGMCQGPGCYKPFSEGLSQSFGSGTGGPGKGYGGRKTAKDGATDTFNTKIKGETRDAPVVASWYFKGSQIKGEAQRDFSQVTQAARDNAAEAISENRIPRRYEESVKKYFDHFNTGAATPEEATD